MSRLYDNFRPAEKNVRAIFGGKFDRNEKMSPVADYRARVLSENRLRDCIVTLRKNVIEFDGCKLHGYAKVEDCSPKRKTTGKTYVEISPLRADGARFPLRILLAVVSFQ